MVAVPTSNICTMCGALPARNAAIAATMVSGYEPLKVGLTWYWVCDSLKSVAIFSRMPPSGMASPCQNSTVTRGACARAGSIPPANHKAPNPARASVTDHRQYVLVLGMDYLQSYGPFRDLIRNAGSRFTLANERLTRIAVR